MQLDIKQEQICKLTTLLGQFAGLAYAVAGKVTEYGLSMAALKCSAHLLLNALSRTLREPVREAPSPLKLLLAV